MAIRQTTRTILDIGASHVKILQLNGSGRIARYAIEKLPDGCIKGLFIEAEEPLVKAIRAARHKSDVPGGGCILTLSGKDMIVRHLNLPKLPEKQLYQNVLLEMTGYLPVDSEKHAIDYKIVEEIREENNVFYRIMVAAVHKQIIARFSHVLRAAGFSIRILDAVENAQEKLIRAAAPKQLGEGIEGVCVVDMGADTTKINVYSHARFFVGYLLNRGGGNITGLVAQHLQTDSITAENYKRSTDFFNDANVNPLLRAAVKNEADTLLYEISKVADYYWSRANKPLGSVVLCGGGSLLKGFEDYFRSNIRIPLYGAAQMLPTAKSFKASDAQALSFLLNAYAASYREE